MFPFQRIVIPVDYSESGLAIAPYAVDLVRHFPASITLLHAFSPNVLVANEMAMADRTWVKRMRELEEKRLVTFASEMFAGLPVRTTVVEGDPAGAIHTFVQSEGADLIMMPTEGHGPMRRFLLGSVTSKVLHDVSAAVWTINHAALSHETHRVPYRSIVCAIDETEEAEAVLRAARTFACKYKADLSLIHAVPSPPLAFEADYAVFRRDLMEAADLKLREWKDALDIQAPHHVVDGPIVDVVCGEIEKRGADLLITGRGRAQGAVSRAWSRLYALMREAPCPVLSV